MLGPSGHIDSFSRDNLPSPSLWPELATENFSYPEWLNAGVALTDAMVADGHGARTALVGANSSYTYSELATWTDRLAQVLIEDFDIVPGNRVMLRGANTPAMVACWLAVMKAGAVGVNTMPMLRASELTTIVDKAEIVLALCDARLRAEMDICAAASSHLSRVVSFDGEGGTKAELDQLASAKSGSFTAARTGRDDVALLGFTSGTTGVMKATMHFHRDLLIIADGYACEVLQIAPDDVCIGTPPLAFTFGLGGLAIFPLRFGASAVLLEAIPPATFGEAIQTYGATISFTSPTAYRGMLADPAFPSRLKSLRIAVSAGETLPAPIFDEWMDKTHVPILDGIGCTELLHIFISTRLGEAKPGSTGVTVSGYEAKIVDEHMNEMPRGKAGDLAVRGPTGCRYLADNRQSGYVRDGWNLTGDTFTQDETGDFHFVARSDDMIVSAGYNIAGPEIEAVLLAHPEVEECAVVGAPDPERGQIVEAHVILNNGVAPDTATAKRLQDYVKAKIAPYKYPRSIKFTDTLPKTQTGKIQRFLLREPV